MHVMNVNAFPDEFSIRMLKTIWHNGKQEKGKELRVPKDVPRQTAIHWCLRPRPLAEAIVLVENPPSGDPIDSLQDELVDVLQGQNGESGVTPVEPPENPDPPADPPQDENSTKVEDPLADPPDTLETLSYAELQTLAKERGLRSVGVSRDALIESLK